MVIRAELKKIFRPIPTVIFALITAVQLWSYHTLYTAYESSLDYIEAAAEFTKLYGTEITPEKRLEAESLNMTEGTDFILKNYDLKTYYRYGTFINSMENSTEVSMSLHKQTKTSLDSGVYVMQAGYNEKEAERFYEVLNETPFDLSLEFHVLIPSLVSLAALMSIITIFILCAPLLTRDNLTKATFIQYHSKRGRKTLQSQLSAILITAFLVTVTHLTAAGVYMFGFFNLTPFLDNLLVSGGLGGNIWFKGTIAQYLICVTALTFLLTVGFAFLVFLISKASDNYIGLLLTGIIFTSAFAFFTQLALSETFSFSAFNLLYQKIRIPYIEIYFCILIFTSAIPFLVYVFKKYKSCDIV
ncbi:MAG: hypothetical protein FWG90_05800 [Oscillospiraceae bacterium]|nr:hypothetical protein [Oscillospiraceae bacterium]